MRREGLIELPNGQRIFYDDEKHAYYRARWAPDKDGGSYKRSTRLTGCSTLAKVYDWKPDKLLAWKERETLKGIVALLDGWEGPTPDWLYDWEVIRGRLREHRVDADSRRDRKGGVGTRTHLVLEGLAGHGELVNVTSLPAEEQGYARAVIDWWHTRDPLVLDCEQFVYSETHGYAGRFDLRAEIDGQVLLIDLKTGWVGNGAHIQMQLYAIAALECGVGACDEVLILQVKDDGTWKEIPCQATEADALAAISVYRGATAIERKAA